MNWVPVASILFYVVTSMIGLLPIPWTMTAELFPIEIRGVAHSIAYSMANVLMFLSVQSYETLNYWFSGAAGVQWFFAVVSLAGLVYTFVFLPETHRKKLTDIEDYFNHNTVYLGQSKDDKKKKKTKKSATTTTTKQQQPQIVVSRVGKKDIVKSNGGQSDKLMENV